MKKNFFTVLVSYLGIKPCYKISLIAALGYFLFFPSRRRSILLYAKLMEPESSGFRRFCFALRTCQKHIQSVLTAASIPLGQITINTNGIEIVDQKLREKQGVVILCSHFGPWLSVFAVMHMLCPIHIVGQRSTGFLWNDKFMSNESAKNRVNDLNQEGKNFTLSSTFFALQDGDVVGMPGDRMIEKKRKTVSFLGHQAYFPIAPYWVAQRANAVIIPVFAVLRSEREIELQFCDPIYPQESLDDMRQIYLDLLEKNINGNPYQFSPPEESWIAESPALPPTDFTAV